MPFSGKFVIVGHSGFVGRALSEECCRRGVAFLSAPSSRDLGELKKIIDGESTLVILSGVTLDREKDSLDIFKANAGMIADLAQILLARPVRKCIYFSSVSVYGDRTTNMALNEDTPPAPTTFYGIAKLAGEWILRQVADEKGFRLLVVRPCRVYGPGANHANYGPVRFIRSILDHEAVELYGDGKEQRDYLYIKDCVRLVLHLAGEDYSGVYNLASGRSYSMIQIVDHLRCIVSQPPRLAFVPRTRPLIDQRYDVTKLVNAVPGFRFTELEQGLQETYRALLVSESGKAGSSN